MSGERGSDRKSGSTLLFVHVDLNSQPLHTFVVPGFRIRMRRVLDTQAIGCQEEQSVS